MKALWWFSLSVCGVVNCLQTIEQDFKGFDDTILFNINWPGEPETTETLVEGDTNKSESNDILTVTSVNKEKYECQLPELNPKESSNIEDYSGPTPLRLLSPLFSQKICSYRLETYWSYEVCHGMYVRQYHENREEKKTNTQEYYLGLWRVEKMAVLEEQMKVAEEAKEPLKTLKMEGLSLPYVEMVMDEGTVCDLSGKPRLTRVRYVCDTHGKHEVFSLKETATCEYEIIILSPLLCEHPKFKPKNVGEKVVTCKPLDGAPKKPRSLLKLEAENLKMQYQTIKLITDKEPRDVLAVLKIDRIDKDGSLNFELHPVTDMSELSNTGKGTAELTKLPTPFMDDSPVRAFLNGENCLHGGTGWWKYEFCYGKHVVQYHVDRAGERHTLQLGAFHEENHLAWLRENPGKAPKPLEKRTSVSHFYSNGDICDKTGKPRQTEVKLKCPENSSSPAQVSLYLLEPKTCYYILGVESPLICDILPLADESGLIKNVKLNPFKRELGEDSNKERKDKKESEPAPKDVEKIDTD